MNRKAVTLVLALSCVWGSEFLLVAVALRNAGPVEVTFTRLGIAAVVLVVVARLRRKPWPAERSFYGHCMVLGLIGQAAPVMLLSLAQQRIDSSVAAVISGTVPLVTLALAALFLRSERITVTRVVGLVLGFVGLVFVVGPWRSTGGADIVGSLAAFGTACGFALNYVYNAKFVIHHDVDAPVAMAIQTVFASVWMVPLLVSDGALDFGSGAGHLLVLVALGVVSTAAGHLLFFTLLRVVGAIGSTVVEYLMTVIAVALGVAFLDEALTVAMIAGVALVIAGIALAERRPRPQSAPRSDVGSLSVEYDG